MATRGKRGRKRARGIGVGGVLVLLLLLLAVLVLAALGVASYVLLQEIPSIATLMDYRPSIATRVYADNNELVDEFYLEDRKIIKVSQVPKVVIQAFVSAEDSRFFEHKGLDFASISRAFYKNLGAGRIVQGGSTITQQVAKSLYLTPERSYLRKIKEAILAYKIDRYLSKEEILNLYLNHIYLGHGTYGIEAAAEGYFGKSARYLTLPEAALLAGLPKAPNTYSPYSHFNRARERQIYVLDRMYDDGYITKQDRERAIHTPLVLRSMKPKEKIAPYFIEHVRRYIQEKYGSEVLYREGLEVYTTLNIQMQKAANEALEKGLQELEARQQYEKGLVQGAILSMEMQTGAVKAMVGGRNFLKSEFNRAIQSRRLPGSAFKPIIYTAAFDKGLTPSTKLNDAPVEFPDPSAPDGVWRPKNYDGRFNGPTTLRNAVVQSRNILTIKVLQNIGVDYAVSYAANLGIVSPLARNLSLALGTSAVTLQEMVRAYGAIGNQGQRVTPYFITKIVDRTGEIFEETQPRVEQVIDPRIAFLATNVLQDVVESGTGRRVRGIGRPVAGKTGTTNDVKDAWFIGYTPSIVTGVWVGFDQERTLGHQEVGGRAAAPIWLYCMSKALADTPIETFPVPEGIVFVRVDPKTGNPSSGPNVIYEAFIDGMAPDGAEALAPHEVRPDGTSREEPGED